MVEVRVARLLLLLFFPYPERLAEAKANMGCLLPQGALTKNEKTELGTNPVVLSLYEKSFYKAFKETAEFL